MSRSSVRSDASSKQTHANGVVWLNANRPSFPATSPSTCSSDSGSCHIPHRGSARPMNSWWRSWYSSDWRSQKARLSSDELIVREPEADLACGRLGRIGAVHEVVRHREREV